MLAQRPITFVVATYGTEEILQNNLLASPCFQSGHRHEIIVQRDYSSAAKAYNEAISRASNEIIVFVHQDIFFPESWLEQLEQSLLRLDTSDPEWGVIGCCGVTRKGDMRGWVFHPTQGLMGKPFDDPEVVQTLDEIVLIVRKSSGLQFDENLPYFHLYGTGICLRAARMGAKCYAISAFCVHNGSYLPVLPKEFYDCCEYIRKTWKDVLPVSTSCGVITRMRFPIYKRRLQETYIRYIQRKAILIPRSRSGAELMRVCGVVRGSEGASSV